MYLANDEAPYQLGKTKLYLQSCTYSMVFVYVTLAGSQVRGQAHGAWRERSFTMLYTILHINSL